MTDESTNRQWAEGTSPLCEVREYPMGEPTPGPWHAEWRPGIDSTNRGEWGFAEVVAGEEAILRADRGTPNDIANVQLAAAARDMLDALGEARSALEVHAGNDQKSLLALSHVDRAIAKARGKG